MDAKKDTAKSMAINPMPRHLRLDLTGDCYGRWTVLGFDARRNDQTYWVCRCECGEVRSVHGGNLRSGHTTQCQHCGLGEAKSTHGKSREPIYKIYHSIKAAGCVAQWKKFESFYACVGDPPGNGQELRKISKQLLHGPGNTVWAPGQTSKASKDATIEAAAVEIVRLAERVEPNVDVDALRSRLRGVSRERRRQLLLIYRGKLAAMQGPGGRPVSDVLRDAVGKSAYQAMANTGLSYRALLRLMDGGGISLASVDQLCSILGYVLVHESELPDFDPRGELQ